jgi:SAM-dependent methyltransferase
MIHFYKALADETRLKITAILSMGEFSVHEVTRILGMGQSRISRHLKILSDAQIADFRRDGAKVFYTLAGEPTGYQNTIIQLTIEWCKEQTDWRALAAAVEEILEWRRSQSRLFFATVGQDWSTLLGHFIDQGEFIQALKALMDGVDILADLGCGPGFVLRELSSVVDHLIGVDYSDKMLQHARDNLRDLRASGQVDLRLGAIEHLPLRDGEVDAVLINLVLHHIAEPHGIFSEVNRVLKPGGSVIIIDFKKHENESFREEMADIWLGFETKDLSIWLKNAGFKDIHVGFFPGGRNTVELVAVQGKKQDSSLISQKV